MTIKINRRTFLQTTGALVAATAVIGSPRQARAAVSLTLGHGAAPGGPMGYASPIGVMRAWSPMLWNEVIHLQR